MSWQFRDDDIAPADAEALLELLKTFDELPPNILINGCVLVMHYTDLDSGDVGYVHRSPGNELRLLEMLGLLEAIKLDMVDVYRSDDD